MEANWYLVKYVPDPFRDEPRNIGVIVEKDGRGAVRFIGQRNGGFDGRRVRGVVRSARTMRAWIDYVEYHLESGTFCEQVQRLSARPGQNYRIDFRGSVGLSAESGLQAIADDLFHELVSDAGLLAAASIDDLTNELLFQRLSFPKDREIERDVSYRVDLRGQPHELGFDYRYESDRTTLLDKISLSAPAKSLGRTVHDLMFRIEHVHRAATKEPSFVTLYDLGKAKMTEPIENHLRAIERYSHTINVRDERAAESVAEQLGVPLLQCA
ncbi:hypothetical protein [Streptomyces sp. NPDC088719]|uniref:hypothetical protein n=1 Tax=Streptomyces sp. NPDC088719 TaxID=3365872 RepID=UPI0037FDDAFD